MMHSDDVIADILSHHGVKGMKWGVRREKSSSVTVSDKGKKLKTSGGYNHPAHPDAVRARKISQVGKKSGLKALSNEELRAFNERLNLEQNAKRLAFQDQSKAKKFVSTLLGRNVSRGVETGGKAAGSAALSSSYVRKRAATGAAALALAL
jgi:hypothetical protein